MLVKLKWGMEYKGFLASVDSYMNLQVSSSFDVFLFSLVVNESDIVSKGQLLQRTAAW